MHPDYYHPGLPYLDGFTGLYAAKQAVRVDAVRSDRAAIDFRNLPPAARDEIVGALGEKIAVQESDLNCGNLVTPNHKRKPFDDVRVRRALTLAIDRWNGATALAKIAVLRTVGGIVFPESPLAAKRDELETIAGFWPDIGKSRAEAKRLLKEAGAEGLSFELLNRDLDQPFKYLGTWLVDQWSKIGLNVFGSLPGITALILGGSLRWKAAMPPAAHLLLLVGAAIMALVALYGLWKRCQRLR